MKVYVSARFENRADAKYIMAKCRAEGHEITHDWTGHDAPGPGDLCRWSVEDLDGVRRCDAMIWIPPGGNGAHCELGAALALGKPVFILGYVPPRVFYRHPFVYVFRYLEDLMMLMKWCDAHAPTEDAV